MKNEEEGGDGREVKRGRRRRTTRALQIGPFGGEDDAPESFDGDGDDGKCRKMWR